MISIKSSENSQKNKLLPKNDSKSKKNMEQNIKSGKNVKSFSNKTENSQSKSINCKKTEVVKVQNNQNNKSNINIKPKAIINNQLLLSSKYITTRKNNYKIFSKNFRKYKSHSQMDFHYSNHFLSTIIPSDSEISIPSAETNQNVQQTFRVGEHFYYFTNNCFDYSDVDIRLAGLKIYTSILLNSWRRRRADIKNLTDELSRLKKNNIKHKNRIQVLNSLYKMEQKKNSELNNEFKKFKEDIKKVKHKYDKLNKSQTEIKEQISKMEDELLLKIKENENLNVILKETRSDLFKAMNRERELKELCTNEQRKCILLENEKNELNEKLAILNSDYDLKDKEYEEQISYKNKTIDKYKNQKNLLQTKLHELEKMDYQLKEFQSIDRLQRQTIQDLNNRLIYLKNEIENSFTYRIKSFLNILPNKTLAGICMFTYILLPAMPLTEISFDLNNAIDYIVKKSIV